VDGIANGGISYTFADTNIHDERLKSTIWLESICRYAYGATGIARRDAE
jgi:hypothetical protein